MATDADRARWARNKARWKAKNPEAYREMMRKAHAKHNALPHRKLAMKMRKRLHRYLGKKVPSLRAEELFGCTPEQLIGHIEQLFKLGMTWENWGEWHVDHIRPLISFDLTDPDQLRAANHYSNLQPLWGFENLAKGSKVS